MQISLQSSGQESGGGSNVSLEERDLECLESRHLNSLRRGVDNHVCEVAKRLFFRIRGPYRKNMYLFNDQKTRSQD